MSVRTGSSTPAGKGSVRDRRPRSRRGGFGVLTAALAIVVTGGTAHASASVEGYATALAGLRATPFPAYVAAFNSESSANQITLGNARTAAHVSRTVALKSALRQEPGAVVLGSGLGAFRSAPYHYKPFAVWVFALDPGGPHNQPNEGPPGNHANLWYNYDVLIVRASTGVIVEEAMGWDKSLPPLPLVKPGGK